jgi:hypothetical protein
MGLLSYVPASDPSQRADLLAALADRVQCTPGIDLPFGEAQRPGLQAYADRKDTFSLLQSRASAR